MIVLYGDKHRPSKEYVFDSLWYTRLWKFNHGTKWHLLISAHFIVLLGTTIVRLNIRWVYMQCICHINKFTMLIAILENKSQFDQILVLQILYKNIHIFTFVALVMVCSGYYSIFIIRSNSHIWLTINASSHHTYSSNQSTTMFFLTSQASKLLLHNYFFRLFTICEFI